MKKKKIEITAIRPSVRYGSRSFYCKEENSFFPISQMKDHNPKHDIKISDPVKLWK
jgi:uncharacterized membrane protein